MEGLRPFSRIFDFSGRSGRAEFWQFMGLLWAMMVVVVLVEDAFGGISIFSSLLGLITLIPQLSVAVRRLHDSGKSGWWIAGYNLMFVFVGLAIVQQKNDGDIFKAFGLALLIIVHFVWFMTRRGDEEENKYGYPDGAENIENNGSRYPLSEPAQTWTPPAQTPSTDDTMARIERLGALRERGLLSEDEFMTQKAAILAQG